MMVSKMTEQKERLRELLQDWGKLKIKVDELDELVFSILGIRSYEEYFPKMKLNIIIACAGNGSRFKVNIPKIIYRINGKMVFEYINDIIKKYAKDTFVIVSESNCREIREAIQPICNDIHYVIEKEQFGDGDAIYQIRNYINEKNSSSLIFWGDAIYQKKAVQRIIALHQIFNNDFTCLTEYVEGPYAGFIRNDNGELLRTFHSRIGISPAVGENDCSFFVCATKILMKYLEIMSSDYELKRSNGNTEEMYFIHILDYMKKDKLKIDLICCMQKNDVLEFNTLEEAKLIERVLMEK